MPNYKLIGEYLNCSLDDGKGINLMLFDLSQISEFDRKFSVLLIDYGLTNNKNDLLFFAGYYGRLSEMAMRDYYNNTLLHPLGQEYINIEKIQLLINNKAINKISFHSDDDKISINDNDIIGQILFELKDYIEDVNSLIPQEGLEYWKKNRKRRDSHIKNYTQQLLNLFNYLKFETTLKNSDKVKCYEFLAEFSVLIGIVWNSTLPEFYIKNTIQNIDT